MKTCLELGLKKICDNCFAYKFQYRFFDHIPNIIINFIKHFKISTNNEFECLTVCLCKMSIDDIIMDLALIYTNDFPSYYSHFASNNIEMILSINCPEKLKKINMISLLQD